VDNKLVARAVLGMVMSVGVGCADATTPSDGERTAATTQGLSIGRHDSKALEGTFVDADATILFKAIALSAERAELELTINGKVLGYEGMPATESHNGWFTVAADLSLTEADIIGASAALDALTDMLGDDETAMAFHEAAAFKMTNFLAHQTAGTTVASFHRNEYLAGAPGWRTVNDDGVTCIKKNTTVTAYYRIDTLNPIVTVQKGVLVGQNPPAPIPSACGQGDYRCMGRCGGGCTGFGSGKYTQDCLEHDICSLDMCSTTGGSDPNCGQEYSHATGDTTAFFSSCNG